MSLCQLPYLSCISSDNELSRIGKPSLLCTLVKTLSYAVKGFMAGYSMTMNPDLYLRMQCFHKTKSPVSRLSSDSPRNKAQVASAGRYGPAIPMSLTSKSVVPAFCIPICCRSAPEPECIHLGRGPLRLNPARTAPDSCKAQR